MILDQEGGEGEGEEGGQGQGQGDEVHGPPGDRPQEPGGRCGGHSRVRDGMNGTLE